MVKSIASLDTVVVNVSEEVAQAPLPKSDYVAVSEADYYVSALDGLTPVNDPHYVDQWALPAIGAPDRVGFDGCGCCGGDHCRDRQRYLRGAS